MSPQLEAPPAPTSSSLLVPHGTLQLYTNPGRESYTPVMAQALRMAGQGTPVLVVQFLKGGINQGPERAITLGSYLTWVRCGIHRYIDTPHLEPEEHLAFQGLWQFTREAMATGEYGLIVLDELSLAIRLGLVPEETVLELLDTRPISLDVMITGPDMPESLMERADLITQLRHR